MYFVCRITGVTTWDDPRSEVPKSEVSAVPVDPLTAAAGGIDMSSTHNSIDMSAAAGSTTHNSSTHNSIDIGSIGTGASDVVVTAHLGNAHVPSAPEFIESTLVESNGVLKSIESVVESNGFVESNGVDDAAACINTSSLTQSAEEANASLGWEDDDGWGDDEVSDAFVLQAEAARLAAQEARLAA